MKNYNSVGWFFTESGVCVCFFRLVGIVLSVTSGIKVIVHESGYWGYRRGYRKVKWTLIPTYTVTFVRTEK